VAEAVGLGTLHPERGDEDGSYRCTYFAYIRDEGENDLTLVVDRSKSQERGDKGLIYLMNLNITTTTSIKFTEKKAYNNQRFN